MTRGVIEIGPGDALIVVDVQNDFLPGGALAVPHGDAVIAVLDSYCEKFDRRRAPVFATRDWHPSNHCSFIAQGGAWPMHCVAGTQGAELSPALALPRGSAIISKGCSPDRDAYSGFQETQLAQRLQMHRCRRVFIGGLATDYCVHDTALDARKQGLDTLVLEDAVRAVNLHPGDGAKALADMVAHGVKLISLPMVSA